MPAPKVRGMYIIASGTVKPNPLASYNALDGNLRFAERVINQCLSDLVISSLPMTVILFLYSNGTFIYRTAIADLCILYS